MVTPSLSLRRQGTTPKIRKEIQESQESIAALAKRLSLNPKTVMKWRNAASVEDAKSGAKKVRSSFKRHGSAGDMRIQTHDEIAIR